MRVGSLSPCRSSALQFPQVPTIGHAGCELQAQILHDVPRETHPRAQATFKGKMFPLMLAYHLLDDDKFSLTNMAILPLGSTGRTLPQAAYF